MHSYLGKESAKSCYLCVGRELFVCQGMIFGLTVSPQKYQMLNNVLVGNMVRHGHDVLLYLDDRLTSSLITRALVGNESTITNYCLLAGLTMLGNFLSLNKCTLKPTTNVDYLGFDLDTEKCDVSVPVKKHEKFCALVETFKNSGPQREVKLLERLRGKCCSWILVLTNARLFIR